LFEEFQYGLVSESSPVSTDVEFPGWN